MLKSVKRMIMGIFLFIVGLVLTALGIAIGTTSSFLILLPFAGLVFIVSIAMVIDGYTDNDEEENTSKPVKNSEHNSTEP